MHATDDIRCATRPTPRGALAIAVRRPGSLRVQRVVALLAVGLLAAFQACLAQGASMPFQIVVTVRQAARITLASEGYAAGPEATLASGTAPLADLSVSTFAVLPLVTVSPSVVAAVQPGVADDSSRQQGASGFIAAPAARIEEAGLVFGRESVVELTGRTLQFLLQMSTGQDALMRAVEDGVIVTVLYQ